MSNFVYHAVQHIILKNRSITVYESDIIYLKAIIKNVTYI